MQSNTFPGYPDKPSPPPPKGKTFADVFNDRSTSNNKKKSTIKVLRRVYKEVLETLAGTERQLEYGLPEEALIFRTKALDTLAKLDNLLARWKAGHNSIIQHHIFTEKEEQALNPAVYSNLGIRTFIVDIDGSVSPPSKLTMREGPSPKVDVWADVFAFKKENNIESTLIQRMKLQLNSLGLYDAIMKTWSSDRSARKVIARDMELLRFSPLGMAGYGSIIIGMVADLRTALSEAIAPNRHPLLLNLANLHVKRDEPVLIKYLEQTEEGATQEHETLFIGNIIPTFMLFNQEAGWKAREELGFKFCGPAFQFTDGTEGDDIYSYMETSDRFRALIDGDPFFIFWVKQLPITEDRMQEIVMKVLVLMQEMKRTRAAFAFTNGFDWTFGQLSGSDNGRELVRTEIFYLVDENTDTVDTVYTMLCAFSILDFVTVEKILLEGNVVNTSGAHLDEARLDAAGKTPQDPEE